MAVSDFLPFIWIPDAFLCFGFHTSFRGNDRTSAVPITYLSSASPSSQTGGCRHDLALPVIAVLSAVTSNTSTISNLIIISQLNHFTFVSALLLPVLGLSLTLPLRLQLKPDVTASAPRTRYRRLARPYLIGFSYCIVISLPRLAEFPPLARGNQLR